MQKDHEHDSAKCGCGWTGCYKCNHGICPICKHRLTRTPFGPWKPVPIWPKAPDRKPPYMQAVPALQRPMWKQ